MYGQEEIELLTDDGLKLASEYPGFIELALAWVESIDFNGPIIWDQAQARVAQVLRAAIEERDALRKQLSDQNNVQT